MLQSIGTVNFSVAAAALPSVAALTLSKYFMLINEALVALDACFA